LIKIRIRDKHPESATLASVLKSGVVRMKLINMCSHVLLYLTSGSPLLKLDGDKQGRTKNKKEG
jgi:hypothetical protein